MLVRLVVEDSEQLIGNPAFDQVLSAIPQFIKSVSLKMLLNALTARRFEKMRRLKCSNCRRKFAIGFFRRRLVRIAVVNVMHLWTTNESNLCISNLCMTSNPDVGLRLFFERKMEAMV